MKRHLIAIACGTCLVLGSMGAQAAAGSAATLSDFTIRLYDLNPADGITPAVTFISSNGSYASSYEYSATPYSSSADAQYSGAALGAVSSSSAGPAVSANAAFSGTVAQTSAAAGAADYSYGYSWLELGDGGGPATFTLSADTVMVISGVASLSAYSTQASFYDYAGSQISLGLSGTNGSGSQSSNASYQTLAGAYYGYPTTSTAGGNMAVTFVNASSTSVATGQFYSYMGSWAQSYQPASTVPEPANLALMAAGLGAIGLMSRRRRGN